LDNLRSISDTDTPPRQP